jgi:Alpha/beta hydrolase family
VIFVPGAGSFGLDFALVQERVSKFATAILYDRAGTDWSDDAVLPRSATEVTDELRAVLRATAGPAPYVLVGHSLGGAYVQRYYNYSLMKSPASCFSTRRMSQQFTPLFSAYPDAIRDDVIERHLGADRLMAGVREGLNFLDVLEGLRAGGIRPDVPLILLNGMAIDPAQAPFRSEAQLQEQITASRQLYESVVDAAPEGEYRHP